MGPKGEAPDAATWVHRTLALLDEGGLPALALDTRERVVRSLNGSLERALSVDADEVEDEVVHAIVAEVHHDLVEAVLDAIDSGVNVGPMLISVHAPGADEARPSIWSRTPGIPEGLEATVVMLCQPAQDPDAEGSIDPFNPEGHPGLGRIPPSPPGWRGRGEREG